MSHADINAAADRLEELSGQIRNAGMLTNNAPYFCEKSGELDAIVATLRQIKETA